VIESRDKSILDPSSNLEHLHTFKKVPVSMGCTSESVDEDIISDQVWDICKNTGIIQLRNPLPLDLVYKFPHNDGVGDVWENHYRLFADFINQSNVSNIVEIGGGTGRLGKLFLQKNPESKWTMIEPNHTYESISMDNFKHVREWFTDDYNLGSDYDAIIHSHVFEHSYDPKQFLKTIHNQISEDKFHIFSFPNLKKFIQNKFTNALNFEHTVFLTEDITDILLKEVGFSIIKKDYYGDHSIFYICKKTKPQSILYPEFIYEDNKRLFLEYINFYKKEIEDLNSKIEAFNGKVFLFGAHIFSQFLIFNGLNTNRISCILDNSKMKQGNRLYGTNLMVKSPEFLKDTGSSVLILKTAAYNQEIKDQILFTINNKVKFFE
jgi:hypothetical protein